MVMPGDNFRATVELALPVAAEVGGLGVQGRRCALQGWRCLRAAVVAMISSQHLVVHEPGTCSPHACTAPLHADGTWGPTPHTPPQVGLRFAIRDSGRTVGAGVVTKLVA